MMPTVICPTCNQPHALFWVVDAKGKRKLHVNCDRQAVTVKTDHGPEMRHHACVICVHTPALEKEHKKNKDIPEQWSSRWREKKKKEQSCELRLL